MMEINNLNRIICTNSFKYRINTILQNRSFDSLSIHSINNNSTNNNTINRLSASIINPYSIQSIRSIALVGAPLRPKVTTIDLLKFKQRGKKITMVTAYTYPSSMHVDSAGIDCILVGDSLAMVEQGHDTTLPITVDEMLYHCKSVSRGSNNSLLIGDLPFGSYEANTTQAYHTAVRFLKEGGMDAIKLEGGIERADTVRTIVNGGIAVMGHIGLTPQRISVLGGFRAQGKTVSAVKSLIADAKALEAAGAFAIVIECVPAVVAEAITAAINIPTIGIGSGSSCDGQVLVYHDLLGFFHHAHHAKVAPSFCKQYAAIGAIIQSALEQFKSEVELQQFPTEQYSPYKLNDSDSELFDSTIRAELESAGIQLLQKTTKKSSNTKKSNTDSTNNTDSTIKVY